MISDTLGRMIYKLAKAGRRSTRSNRRRSQMNVMPEALEVRTLLAAVFDDGSTLTIELEADEKLELQSYWGSYLLRSDRPIVDGGLQNPEVADGLGSPQTRVTQIQHFDDIRIIGNAGGNQLSIGTEDAINGFSSPLTVSMKDDQPGSTRTGSQVTFLGRLLLNQHDLNVQTNGRIHLAPEAEIITNEGNLSFEVTNNNSFSDNSAHSTYAAGIQMDSAIIRTTGSGNISLISETQTHSSTSVQAVGIAIDNGSQILSERSDVSGGKITLNGSASGGHDLNIGVLVSGYSTIQSSLGDISLSATLSQRNDPLNNASRQLGIAVFDSVIESTGTGGFAADIHLSNTIRNHHSSDGRGILVRGSNSRIESVDGSILLAGHGASQGQANHGVIIDQADVWSVGTGDVQIHGVTDKRSRDTQGVWVKGSDSSIQSGSGLLRLSATITPPDRYTQPSQITPLSAVKIGDGADVISRSGPIQLFVEGDRQFYRGVSISVGMEDSSDPSIIQSGDAQPISIQFGDQTSDSGIQLGRSAQLGGAEYQGDILLSGDHHSFDGGAVIDSAGVLKIERPTISFNGTFTLGTQSGLSQQAIETISDRFQRIDIAAGNTPIRFYYVTFASPIRVSSDRSISFADKGYEGLIAAITAPAMELAGNIRFFDLQQINTDVTVKEGSRVSISLDDIGTSISIDGQLTIEDNVELRINENPFQRLDHEHVIVANNIVGEFSNAADGQPVMSAPNYRLHYQRDKDGNSAIGHVTLVADDSKSLPVYDEHLLDSNYLSHEFTYPTQALFASARQTGDVNGDTIPDLVYTFFDYSSVQGSDTAPARIFILPGGNEKYNNPMTAEYLEANSIVVNGIEHLSIESEISVSDLNGDGYSDVLIPLDLERTSTVAAIIWGGPELPDQIDIAVKSSFVTKFVLAPNVDFATTTIAPIGDLNHDGIQDLAIGVQPPCYSGRCTQPNQMFVIWGTDDVFDSGITNLESLDSMKLQAVSNQRHRPIRFQGLGDINGDGTDDLAISIPQEQFLDDADHDSINGVSVIFGSTDPERINQWTASTNQLHDVADIFIESELTIQDLRISSSGDVNGDGINDLLVSANRGLRLLGDQTFQIATFLIAGSDTLPSNIVLENPSENVVPIQFGNAPLTIEDEQPAIKIVAKIVGDLDGDGLDDIAIASESRVQEVPRGIFFVKGTSDFPTLINLWDANDVQAVIRTTTSSNRPIDTLLAPLGDWDGDGLDDLYVNGHIRDDRSHDVRKPLAGFMVSGKILVNSESAVGIFDVNLLTSGHVTIKAKFSKTIQGVDANTFVLTVTDSDGVSRPLKASDYLVNTSPPREFFTIYVGLQMDGGTLTVALADSATITDLAGNPVVAEPLEVSLETIAEEPLLPGPVGTPELTELETNFAGELGQRFQWPFLGYLNHYESSLVKLGNEPSVVEERQLFHNSYELPYLFTTGRYRFWVRAIGKNGQIGAWATHTFTVSYIPKVLPATNVDHVSAFQIEYPAGYSRGSIQKWSYRLLVNNLTTGELRVIDRVIDKREFNLDELKEAGRYRIWVAVADDSGWQDEWSASYDVDIAPSLNPIGHTFETQPNISWSTFSDAASYDLHIVSAGETILRYGLMEAEFTADWELRPGTHRVWVRVNDTAGTTSPWSNVMEFQTGGRVQPKRVLTEQTVEAPRLQWANVEGASRYEIFVQRQDTGSGKHPVFRATTSDITLQLPPTPHGRYSAWVKTYSPQNPEGVWGAKLVFEMEWNSYGSPPIRKIGPIGVSFQQHVEFLWEPLWDADHYELIIRNGNQVQIIGPIFDTFYRPQEPLLTDDGEWWIRGIGQRSGKATLGSGTKFTSTQRPDLQSEHILNGRSPITLSWTPVEVASQYDLQIDRLTKDGRWETVLRQSDLQATTFDWTEITNAGKHRAWVKAINGSGPDGPWSSAHDLFVI